MFFGKNSFFQKQDKANQKAGNTQKTTTVTNALRKPPFYLPRKTITLFT